MSRLHFQITAQDNDARCGQLITTHGTISTPTFMPVATYGNVRGMMPKDLHDLGCQIILGNTYHLHERPGEETVRDLGGLHGFTGWNGPWLTDSGGFQITSLASRIKLTERGVIFSSPLDGRRRELTPEKVVEIQGLLGSDIAMVLDECLPIDPQRRSNIDSASLEEITARTIRWAERARKAHDRVDQKLFGIVQGGASPELRRLSALEVSSLDFDGYAHGGLGLGDDLSMRRDLISAANESLPVHYPRYLMGIGKPGDIVDAISQGIDLFDCVLPTRHGRHAILFTRAGQLSIRGARFKDDQRPVDDQCACETCRNHSRAYLRHLFKVQDLLAPRLATIHNLHFYQSLCTEARTSIIEGNFDQWRDEYVAAQTAVAT